MSKRFKITYPNGSNEVVPSDAVDAADQANRTFGKTLDELAEIGASVEEVGNRTKPEGLQDIPEEPIQNAAVVVSEAPPGDTGVIQEKEVPPPPPENDPHSDQVAQTPLTHGIDGEKGLVEVGSPVGSKTVEAVPMSPVVNPFAPEATAVVAQAAPTPGPVTLEPAPLKAPTKPKKATAAPTTAAPPSPWAPAPKEVTRSVEESSKSDTK